TFDLNGKLQMENIPASGDCDRFLWRTKDIGGGKRLLINKAKGENSPLLLSASGALSFASGQGVQEWEIKPSDVNKYGTNAYQLIGANATKALSFTNVVQADNPVAGNKNQTWVLQFNQMVRDYFLPLPTKANLLAHYVDNPNVNVNTSAEAIAASYNKFLKGTNGVTFFATNTSSDWVLVNYYLTITNMLNAIVSPKPSDPKVDPNLVKTLAALKGQSLILINKNDLNSAVPSQFFTTWMTKPNAAQFRGMAAYGQPKKAILANEELTCKTGIVNRPLDNTFRKFDHGVHEFWHAVQELCGYIPIVDANNMCDSERGKSSECFCFYAQTWFNSNGSNYYYPGLRAYDAARASFMKKIFNESNTWQPPVDLRLNGYNPSGSPAATTPTRDILPVYSISAYPNPFDEVLNIEVRLEKANPLEVEIIDALGRVLRVLKSSNVTDKHFFQVQNLDHEGILFVKVKSDGKYGLVKVVKNN
ncbi:MAG: T9SS type A sorting domain-containing protein, partial [Haliscomenobacter sp.]|uniref:T9SS type A sorting domain-containing protein n=1 Tax=Haliscomenobacter sp. TaxID=2717303 RepID=UPI0029A79D03